jgi:hypothetical protein
MFLSAIGYVLFTSEWERLKTKRVLILRSEIETKRMLHHCWGWMSDVKPLQNSNLKGCVAQPITFRII